MSDIDTTNWFMVGSSGDEIAVMRFGQKLSRSDALNLAAWLVALADVDDEFDGILTAVRST